MQRKTQKLTTTAIMLALAMILSLIKVWKQPWGGSVTLLSMLPIVMISVKYGLSWGIFTGFVYSLLQLFADLGEVVSWGLTPHVLIGTVLFDYIIAFTVLGLSSLFGKGSLEKVLAGISFSVVLRFICHFISGSVLFGEFAWEGWNVYSYSFIYNGAYMLPELIFTLIGATILFKIPAIQKMIKFDC